MQIFIKEEFSTIVVFGFLKNIIFTVTKGKKIDRDQGNKNNYATIYILYLCFNIAEWVYSLEQKNVFIIILVFNCNFFSQ